MVYYTLLSSGPACHPGCYPFQSLRSCGKHDTLHALYSVDMTHHEPGLKQQSSTPQRFSPVPASPPSLDIPPGNAPCCTPSLHLISPIGKGAAMPTPVNTNIDAILELEIAFITEYTRKKWSYYGLPESDVEADDLAQQSLIKLWQALQRGKVTNPNAYAHKIVTTVCIDNYRRSKPVLSLYNEEAQVLYDNQTPSDLSADIEQEEEVTTCVQIATQAILTLPDRQQEAMICALKDRSDDALPLLTSLSERGIDVETTSWPDEPVDRQVLRASLSVARKKLHQRLPSSER